MTKKLHGVTILVPESRELDLFAGMLEAYGARTLRCPLVTILDAAEMLRILLPRVEAVKRDGLIEAQTCPLVDGA